MDNPAPRNNPDPAPRLRFAPSPNGPLHLGHALSALANEAVAAEIGGAVFLRIEDIDETRARAAHTDAARADLAWLGCDWPELPAQSSRLARYRDGLEALRDAGLLYPCHASRAAVREAAQGETDPDGAPCCPARGALSRQKDHDTPAWRLDTRAALKRLGRATVSWAEDGAGPAGEQGRIEADPLVWGDPVIGRRDIGASYHLSVVLDDADQSITHVVRGRDLFHATTLHRLLQETLGLPAPRYAHHRLLLGEDGRKLSKSRPDARHGPFGAGGASPHALRTALGAAAFFGPDTPAPTLGTNAGV